MASDLTGRVTFANGVPAPGVQVRVFDKDAPGKGDDDLTLEVGVSNARGIFTVTYDPGRFRDFAEIPFLGFGRLPDGRSGIRIPDPLDILSPYLQFNYQVNGQDCLHTEEVSLFYDRFRLPETMPISFLPSQNGFRFPNAFHGYMLPFNIPGFPSSKVSGVYGLCGGMSSAAYDHVIEGRSIPAVTQVPKTGSKLQRYLFRRAIDTFAFGESILRFARWMALPEEGLSGTYRLTAGEFSNIREALDQHFLVVLGLVYDKGRNIQEISRNVWNNHQVLAYGYTAGTDGSYRIKIYDPNYPNDDEVTLQLDEVILGEADGEPIIGLKVVEKRGDRLVRPVRGFFRMPYEPVDPPEFPQ